MALLFDETTLSTIAGYAASLPEPVEILIFGAVIASIAFLLRAIPARDARDKGQSEVAKKA